MQIPPLAGPSRQLDRWLLAATLGAALAIAPARSGAQESADRFDELLKQGNAALRGKRALEALSAWRAAWSLKPSHLVACNIGRAERLYGSAREAAEFLTICLRISPVPITQEDKQRRAKFESDLQKVKKEIASLTIEADPDGATILIDNRLIGRSPLPDDIFVEPGAHRISSTLEGYEPADVEIVVVKDEARKIPIALTKSPPPEKAPLSPPLSPLAQRKPIPMTAAPLSKPLIAGGASLSAVGFGLGAGLLISRGVSGSDADVHRADARLGAFEDCDIDAMNVSCSDYLSVQRSRATLGSVATASILTASLTAAATVAYVLFPRSPIAPSIGKGDGVKISF